MKDKKLCVECQADPTKCHEHEKELKPCPTCKGPMEVRSHYIVAGFLELRCKYCYDNLISIPKDFPDECRSFQLHNKEQAIEAWNRRTP